jgi:predicted N-acyltransferase
VQHPPPPRSFHHPNPKPPTSYRPCTKTQYHWENADEAGARYATFDDFLAALKQSRRKTIRQERRAVAKQGVTLRRLSGRAGARGAPGPRHWERFYEFYLSTVDKRWGTAYLTKRFFEM